MRKKWLSRALAAVLTGVLAVGLLAGCGAEKKEESKAPVSSSSAAASSSAAEVVEEKYEVIILLTFLPPSYIKDSLVKELGLPDDYNKSNMN